MTHCTKCHRRLLFGGLQIENDQFCSAACLFQNHALSKGSSWQGLARRLPALAVWTAGYLCLISSVPFMFAFWQGTGSGTSSNLLLSILLIVVGVALAALGQWIDRKVILSSYREALERQEQESA